MHEFISFNACRREVWRGHETKEGVRRAIRYAADHNETLRIFVLDPGNFYRELPPAYWATEFAK